MASVAIPVSYDRRDMLTSICSRSLYCLILTFVLGIKAAVFCSWSSLMLRLYLPKSIHRVQSERHSIANPLFDGALEIVERGPIWVKGDIDHFPAFSAEFIQVIV